MATLPEEFAKARVARLATVGRDNSPHLVPVVFAAQDSTIYTAVDGKPKTSQRLRRLANIEHNPQVSLLVDQYDEDWSQLWWIRVDGTARITDDNAGRVLLRAKYGQYEHVSLDGPVIGNLDGTWPPGV